MTTEYEVHPIANLFPLMEGPDLDELVEDIRNNGLREPITLLKGKILDGRNRYRACLKAWVEPRFDNCEGDPLAFVISRNLHRRHLTTQQRAAIAAELATMKLGDNQYRQEGTSNDAPSPDAKDEDEELREWAKSVDLDQLFPLVFMTRLIKVKYTCEDKLLAFLEGGAPGNLLRRALKMVRAPEPTMPLVTEAQAAKAMKVSKPSLQRAKKRMREDPEAHEAVKAGKKPERRPSRSEAEPPKRTLQFHVAVQSLRKKVQSLDAELPKVGEFCEAIEHAVKENDREYLFWLRKDLVKLAETLQAQEQLIDRALGENYVEPAVDGMAQEVLALDGPEVIH